MADRIDERLSEVRDEYLRRMTSGVGCLLREVETFASGRCGKMLRPRMTLLAAATLGKEHLDSRRTLLLATCTEMLHNASLLHDDVVDHADSRRGQPSVNAQWNSTVAVLVGDYHLASIMELLEEVDDRETSHQVNLTVKAMVEAELLQQETANGMLTLDADTYLRIVDGKTARLFALAARFGNPQYEEFGLHYGRLFQLRDDIADGEATPWTAALAAREEETLHAIKHTLPIPNM